MCLLLLLALLAGGDLHDAVKAGDLARVQALVAGGADVNERDALGSTPLHDAAWAGQKEIAAFLVEHGADVNARHLEGGSTPLHYAVIKNQKDLVQFLLDKGADVRATYRSGETPLHLACERGYKDMVELLLGRGADLNARDASGASALDEASWRGYRDIVLLLLDKGAKQDSQNPETGATPLNEAAAKGSGTWWNCCWREAPTPPSPTKPVPRRSTTPRASVMPRSYSCSWPGSAPPGKNGPRPACCRRPSSRARPTWWSYWSRGVQTSTPAPAKAPHPWAMPP